jgi:ABC-type transport system involved in multi-copper enzyme maturation permease subunit
VVRAAYLGLLWVMGLTAWQVTVGWSETATLGDLARFGTLLFQILTKWVQLPLLLFFAAVSAASAISQEKDRRTFVLLLLTDLHSYEIVLGKLLGSLLQIGVLLIGMFPVLALIVLLGGVDLGQVAQAGLVLAVTALAAGAVGNLIALWREKTFQSLALTVLFLILYFCLVQGLALLPALSGWLFGESAYGTNWDVATWQKWLDPFLALQSVLEPPAPSDPAISPAYGYAGVMVLISTLLVSWGILRLRVWNPSGEPIMQRELPEEEEEKDRAKAHAAPGAVRAVWANPILWREIRTRAYGRRPLLVKTAYALVLGLICVYGMYPLLWGTEERPTLALSPALVLEAVGILSLVLISAQAVTAITSERDTGALDLLLVTDLTPKEFIFGKLGGILYNTKEYLLPPFLVAGLYLFLGLCRILPLGLRWPLLSWRIPPLGLLATPPALHPELLVYKNVEALICLSGALAVLLVFAKVLGVHIALRTENSRLAIIHTLATIFFLSAGTLVCIQLIQINTRFELQWLSFVFFVAAGIGGLWWVLRADRPSTALNVASALCPLGMFYTVVNILIGKPGSQESTDPLIPFLFIVSAFGFTVVAMLVPLLSEFDVALGRTTGGGE